MYVIDIFVCVRTMIRIYIEDVLVLGVENGKAEIRPQKYSVVTNDGTYCGEIQVGVTFAPKVCFRCQFCLLKK